MYSYSGKTSYSGYDTFASIYRESSHFNGNLNINQTIPEIERFIKQNLPREVPENPKILDLCCGTGELVKALQSRGYQVTGLDGSEEMLRYARQNAANSEFILGDARSFQLPSTFHGVISTGLGLNYVLELEELTSVFRNVYNALLADGVFMFDFRMDEHYHSYLQDTVFCEVKDESVWTMVRRYKSKERILQSNVTMFELVEKNWKRSDITWLVKGYFKDEVQSALKEVGFTKISVYDQVSQSYYVCYKVIGK